MKPASDYVAFHARCAYWQEEIPFCLSLSGPDAESYLQSQITQNIQDIAPLRGKASALVDRQAYLRSLFKVFRVDEQEWLILPEAAVENLYEHLQKFHFMEELELQKSPGWQQFRIEGPLATEPIQQLFEIEIEKAEPLSLHRVSVNGGQGWCIVDSLSGYAGVRILAPELQAPAFEKVLTQQLKIPRLSSESFETLRIEAGQVRLGIEITEQNRLTETGMESERVSYDKGCYLGQEVLARVRSYGVAPLSIIGLCSPQDFQDLELVIEGKSRGRIVSSCWSPQLKSYIALAFLNKKYRQSGRELHLDNQEKLRVKRLPFYKVEGAKEQAQKLYEEALDLFAEENEEAAIPLLQGAIQKDPQLADAYESLGVLLSRIGKHEQAIEIMQQLTEIAPEEAMAHTNLSRFHMLLGDKDTAEFHMAEATRLNMLKQSQNLKAEALQQAEIAKKREMMAMFQEVLEEEDPEDLVANFGLGKAYVDLQEYEQAVPYLEKAVQIEPFYSVAYLALGKAYEALDKNTQAKEVYQKGIDAASEKGDLMPLKEMEQRLSAL